MSEMISIAVADGSFDAYLALPEHGPAPAIIVVSSIYGLTQGLKDTIDGYARRGFIVIAPDIFWRTQPGPLEGNRREDAQARLDAYKIGPGMDDLRAVRDLLPSRPEWNGKFAVLGFCFGGQHGFLGLTRLGADAGISFHGSGIQRFLDEADAVSKPFSFHFAADDDLVPLDEVERIRAALAGKEGEIVVYEGATHGFARIEAPRYNAAVARESEERAFAVLDNLKTVAVV
jgi:carboxymethylenebutenolidase